MNIIPRPVYVQPLAGALALTTDTTIVANAGARAKAEQLAAALRARTGLPLPVASASAAPAISLNLEPASIGLGDEGYALAVESGGASLVSATEAGLFYAGQTLRQLVAPGAGSTWEVPCAQIADRPRFGWRGMHLDVARHFMPVDFVRKFVDLLALHKFNVLHLHLTEDQGWRIEIKKYPRLTEVGAWRKETRAGHERAAQGFDGIPHGGYYTQAELRALVAYAAERHVAILPEIEMPGHTQAAIAAYPELGNTGEPLEVWTRWGVNPHVVNVEESTVQFFQDVLREVIDIFPNSYIHVGGDECPKAEWKASPRAQARLRELGLKDEDALQSWFIRRMDDFLNAHGRTLVGWDEILEGGLAQNAVVMSWRGEAGGIAAAQAGHDVVMTPTSHTYFDYYQSRDHSSEPLAIGGYLPLEQVYAYEPVPAQLTPEQARHVLGTQGQLWSEYLPTPEQVEYMAFPRACALAEVAWSPRGGKDYADFARRLDAHLERLAAMGVNYRRG